MQAPLRNQRAVDIARYRATGAWKSETWLEVFKLELEVDPDRVLVFDEEAGLTVRQLWDTARGLAGWFKARGIGHGDVVSFQLPNWREALIVDAAACLVGAISNPIVTIYRDAELTLMLREARSRVLVVPEVFRSTNHLEIADRIRFGLLDIEHVLVVRGNDARSLENACRHPYEQFDGFNPDEPRLLLFTSGTTGHAKGCIHSYNTLRHEIENAAGFWRIGRGDSVLMPSPVTHITGYLYGIVLPLLIGGVAILMERWNADQAIDLIEKHDVVGTCSATPFLTELVAAARARTLDLPSMRFFACGGAPVSPTLVRDATDAFAGCAVFRIYGSSEAPTITLGTMERGTDRSAETEGEIVGHDVRIVDDDGSPQAAGREGEIITRGPEVMLSYIRQKDNEAAFDADGFFHTGDLGRLNPDGTLTVTGRKKDIINRGGEKFSAKEIEDVLLRHPKISEVAVIPAPHARLGETVCAVVVLLPGASMAADDVLAFVAGQGLASQKTPERVEFVTSMPRTASGKVQKHVLKERLQQVE